jgi:acetoacetyl-CoA reductase
MSTTKTRVALVTGGTGGIGTALCRRLVREGCRLATNSRDPQKGLRWQQAMAAEGCEVAVFPGDVSDPAQGEALARAVTDALGPVEILVNNAGITRDVTFRKMTWEQWDAVIRTNLNSVYVVTRPLVEGMIARGFGRIVNISSINGRKGQVGQTNYAAAKAGMHGFTKSLALELANKGVTVNTVSPGYIVTDMVMAIPQAVRERIIGQIPVGRLGTPEEIAAAVAYLVSEEAGFVTGAEISVNGGQHML